MDESLGLYLHNQLGGTFETEGEQVPGLKETFSLKEVNVSRFSKLDSLVRHYYSDLGITIFNPPLKDTYPHSYGYHIGKRTLILMGFDNGEILGNLL